MLFYTIFGRNRTLIYSDILKYKFMLSWFFKMQDIEAESSNHRIL